MTPKPSCQTGEQASGRDTIGDGMELFGDSHLVRGGRSTTAPHVPEALSAATRHPERPAPPEQHKRQRPQGVKLFFHGQRPEVAEMPGSLQRVVDCVGGRVCQVLGRNDQKPTHAEQEHNQPVAVQGRKNSENPTPVKCFQRDPTGGLQFVQK